MNQKKNYKIQWIIPGNDNFISCKNNQIYEIINISDVLENVVNYKWKIINYNQILKYNHDNDNECDSNCDSDTESNNNCNNLELSILDNNYVNCNSKLVNDLNHSNHSNHSNEHNHSIANLHKKTETNEITINKCINSTEKALKKMYDKIETLQNELDYLKKNTFTGYDDKISKLNKKVKTLAGKSALSYKGIDQSLVVVEDFDFETPKTKNFVSALNDMNLHNVKSIFVLPETIDNVVLSSKNIPNTKTVNASDLNVYDILHCDKLVLCESSVNILTERLSK